MDSQFPYDFTADFAFTGEFMPPNETYDIPGQAHDSSALMPVPLSPFKTSFLEDAIPGAEYGLAPQSYMSYPTAPMHLYQPVPTADAYYRQGVYAPLPFTSYETFDNGPSSSILPAQTYDSQYTQHQQQAHESVENPGNEHGASTRSDHFTLSSTTELSGHVRNMSSESSNSPESSATSPHGTSSTDELNDAVQESQPGQQLDEVSAPPLCCSTSSASTRPQTLRFNNFAEAEATAFHRIRPNIINDDWVVVKANPGKYVQILLAAFRADYAVKPEQFSLVKQADKARWLAYQDGHVDKTLKHDDVTLEAACWVLLKNLIEAHEVGMKSLRYHKSEDSIKCSDHVDLVAGALRKYAVIRYDVVRLQRLDELVCCTTSAVNRKIANFRGNANKTEREVENQQKAQAHGIKYVAVLGAKKRKGTASPEDDDAAIKGKAPSKKPRALVPTGVSSFNSRKSSTSSDEVPLKKL
ncbi:hypothetical protein Slin15195_G102120 [Septoria linicola]|uniref:Uncharacterized protein n=1 Tax=Septoria linicola TaxID=215465 RepID=A0A9Q9B3K5_9PEZI|nr:hypothetical protein Slin14017_G065120 [Septoria linicola]USW56893.1 hypothetical protein Slin15195_G102120 [Septoria linicola]